MVQFCERCKYFDPGEGNQGDCRRYPKVPVYGATYTHANGELHRDGGEFGLPEVDILDWCGEFQYRQIK